MPGLQAEWLYDQQELGTWESVAAPDPKEKTWVLAGGQWGGRTALATYALLAAGESHQDPKLGKAIEFLRRADLVHSSDLKRIRRLLPSL